MWENAQWTPPSSGTQITRLPLIHLQVASIQRNLSFFLTDTKKQTKNPPHLPLSHSTACRSMGFPSTDGYNLPRLPLYGVLSSAFPTFPNARSLTPGIMQIWCKSHSFTRIERARSFWINSYPPFRSVLVYFQPWKVAMKNPRSGLLGVLAVLHFGSLC